MKILTFSTSLLLLLSLSSCNTFVGMGKDVQRLGKGMENTGNRAQHFSY